MKDFATSPACPEAASDAVSAHALGLDADEQALLNLQRFYFRSFAEPASQGWMHALAGAEEAFPHLPRGEAAILVLIQVQALRGVRRSAFRFSNPFCPACRLRLTPDEVALATLFRTCRAAQSPRTLAAALSDDTPNPGLEIASTRLAAALCPQAPSRFH